MAKRKQSVFEKYAHEYDIITNAKQRESYHSKEIAALVNKFKPEAVLDAGCATGLSSRLFAKNNIKTIGLDHSQKMIELASELAGDNNYLKYQRGTFEKLPKKFHNHFDLIACLGNSISGASDKEMLQATLRSFYNALQPDGTLVLQLLNYSSIKDGEIMPIRVTSNNGIHYQRYSIRRGENLSVHVIRLDTNKKEPTFEPFVHEFQGLEIDQLLKLIKRTKFRNIRTYGNLYLNKRFGKQSRDLVITAQK